MTAQLFVNSGKQFTLSRRLRATGSDTSIYVAKSSSVSFTQTEGIAKINTGDATEYFSFTGTTVSSTQIIFTGCARGLKFEATSSTDTDSTIKKNHAVGTVVAIVAHSVLLNSYLQEDRDNTVTGSLSFSGTSSRHFTLPTYTTAQRDALSSPQVGDILVDTTTNKLNVYINGAWKTYTPD